MDELIAALDKNFEGEERMRSDALKRAAEVRKRRSARGRHGERYPEILRGYHTGLGGFPGRSIIPSAISPRR